MQSINKTLEFFNRELFRADEELRKQEILHKSEIERLNKNHQKELERVHEAYNEKLDQKDQIIEELKSLLNTNSRNSSMPPSSDRPGQKPVREKSSNEYNSRPETNRKQGGQKGHKGNTLTKKFARELIADGRATERIEDIGDKERPVIREHYIFDIEVKKVITKLRVHEGADSSEIPKTGCYYGRDLKALAVMLYAEGNMSVERVCSIIRELTENDYPVSRGFLYNTLEQFAKNSEESYKQILDELETSPVLYTDATTMPVDGKINFIRSISDGKRVVYIPFETKTVKELLKADLLPAYKGNLVHDHETATYNLRLSNHFECGIHLIRRLRKSQEDTANSWQEKMIALLVEVNNRLEGDQCVLAEEELAEFLNSYDEIIKSGYKENKNTSNKKFRKREKSLLNDLSKYKDNYTGFAYVEGVAFTNNLSERDLRKLVLRRKAVAGLRKFSGLEMVCRITTVTETLKKQNKSLLKGLKKTFN